MILKMIIFCEDFIFKINSFLRTPRTNHDHFFIAAYFILSFPAQKIKN